MNLTDSVTNSNFTFYVHDYSSASVTAMLPAPRGSDVGDAGELQAPRSHLTSLRPHEDWPPSGVARPLAEFLNIIPLQAAAYHQFHVIFC